MIGMKNSHISGYVEIINNPLDRIIVVPWRSTENYWW